MEHILILKKYITGIRVFLSMNIYVNSLLLKKLICSSKEFVVVNRFIRGACTLKLADLCLSLDLFDIISDFRCVCMMFIRGNTQFLTCL